MPRRRVQNSEVECEYREYSSGKKGISIVERLLAEEAPTFVSLKVRQLRFDSLGVYCLGAGLHCIVVFTVLLCTCSNVVCAVAAVFLLLHLRGTLEVLNCIWGVTEIYSYCVSN